MWLQCAGLLAVACGVTAGAVKLTSATARFGFSDGSGRWSAAEVLRHAAAFATSGSALPVRPPCHHRAIKMIHYGTMASCPRARRCRRALWRTAGSRL